MKMKIGAVTLLLFMTGCSGIHRGVVVMKIDDNISHVCLDKGEVQVGDSVRVFRNVCEQKFPGRSGRQNPPVCKKEQLGNGKVTEILNEHYSVVSVPTGVDVKEGDVVEKD